MKKLEKKLTKKQRRKIYENVLNDLHIDSKYFRICIEIADKLNWKIDSHQVENYFYEFELFKDFGIFNTLKYLFYEQQNANELRVFALQLCIEMTK